MSTPKALRLHIGLFGKTNVGKSSILNAIVKQNISIVSDVAGTTTDVVEKSMELFPIGPVTFLDTAGFDDSSELGEKRIQKTLNTIQRTDIALLVVDYNGLNDFDISIIEKLNELEIPYLVIVNKADLSVISEEKKDEILTLTPYILETSIHDKNLINSFVELLIKILPNEFVNSPSILGDFVEKKDVVVFVTPIDKEAPKGRLILPQVQTLRDAIDNNCISIVVSEKELPDALSMLKCPPKLVVTDSQAFKIVDEMVPENIALTSFSILFAKLKGDLHAFMNGADAINNLNNGDKILILESCTHHAIEDDIARVKIPALLKKKTELDLQFEYYTGHDFPDIKPYKLVIHCGACMTNRREVLSRILIAQKENIPITNYGVVISYCLGILPRATRIFNSLI